MLKNNYRLKRREMMALSIIGAASFAAFPSYAKDRISKTRSGVAIKGFDTTAYFEKGGPAKGAAAHVVEWKGAKWQFATAQEAAMFKADPTAFAPQFGGHCTRAMSIRKVVPGDPKVWRIRGDKLYLFYAPVGRDLFDKGADAMIAKAQAYWDSLS